MIPADMIATLPAPLPSEASARLCLLAIRRMGAHGLGDAPLAQHFLTVFGPCFRRPLLAMRIMLTELASASSSEIAIGPCCCPRMTAAEQTLIEVLARVPDEPEAAGVLLADLLGNRNVEAAMASVALVAAAFADAGRPIERH